MLNRSPASTSSPSHLGLLVGLLVSQATGQAVSPTAARPDMRTWQMFRSDCTFVVRNRFLRMPLENVPQGLKESPTLSRLLAGQYVPAHELPDVKGAFDACLVAASLPDSKCVLGDTKSTVTRFHEFVREVRPSLREGPDSVTVIAPGIQLFYDPDTAQLAWRTDAKPYVNTLPMLMQPLPVNRAGLDWLERGVWRKLPAENSWEVHSDSSSKVRFFIETSKTWRGLPVACLRESGRDGDHMWGIYSYRLDDEGVLGLGEAYLVQVSGTFLTMTRKTVTSLRYQVSPRDVLITVHGTLPLVDWRNRRPIGLGVERHQWPDEVKSFTVSGTGMAEGVRHRLLARRNKLGIPLATETASESPDPRQEGTARAGNGPGPGLLLLVLAMLGGGLMFLLLRPRLAAVILRHRVDDKHELQD